MKTEPVKVLYFVDRMLRGGIQSLVIDWVSRFDKNKIHVDFLLLDDGKEYELEQTLKAGLAEFEADRNALIWELGVKTEQGGAYMDTTDLEAMDAFSTRLQELIEKHQESIDAYELRYKEFQEILDEELEADIKFRKIDIDSCPDSGITAEELEKLIDFDIIIE